jgi:hypothetical protein
MLVGAGVTAAGLCVRPFRKGWIRTGARREFRRGNMDVGGIPARNSAGLGGALQELGETAVPAGLRRYSGPGGR